MEKANWWEKLITALLLTFVVGLFAKAGYSNQAPQQVTQQSGTQLSHPVSTTQLP
jgi:predicted negative regulator of RcsB-dependent stress response